MKLLLGGLLLVTAGAGLPFLMVIRVLDPVVASVSSSLCCVVVRIAARHRRRRQTVLPHLSRIARSPDAGYAQGGVRDVGTAEGQRPCQRIAVCGTVCALRAPVLECMVVESFVLAQYDEPIEQIIL